MATEQGRLAQLKRTVQLVGKLLAGESLDAGRAANLLGVRRAAADRQLKALASLPGIVVERGSRPRSYRLDRSSLAASPSLAAAVAACFGSSLAPLFTGTAYEHAMTEARDHVHRLTRRNSEFRHIDRKFVFLTGGGEASLPERGGELDDVIEALLAQKWLSLRYRHFDGTVGQVRIQPLTLLVHYHQLYVVGRDGKGVVHPYRFARIEEIDAGEAGFEYPPRTEYDPSHLFSNSFGVFLGDELPPARVVLRLAKRWATYARSHRWHRSQRIAPEAGSQAILLTLQVRMCPELETWVLGFGEDAEVIEPAELRRRIARRVRQLARKYEADES